MASFYAKVSSATKQDGRSIYAKLEGAFNALDDAELLATLKGKVHRGCQGYPVAVLWRSYLAAYFLNIPTVAALVRKLRDDAALREVCGIVAAPSEATYSRFVAKLAYHNPLVQRVIESGASRLRERLPNFGRNVAVDSSDIPAYSKSRKPSDPDARWSAKRDKHGNTKFWFGYKVHVAADADHELPIQVAVTPANVSDYKSMIPVLKLLPIIPQTVVADAGYDSLENYQFVKNEFGAVPIIKLNKRGKRETAQGKLRITHHAKDSIAAYAVRDYPGVDRESDFWQMLYAKRTGIERLFSRMAEFRRLKSVHHRGLTKVTLHCYLSTLTIVASALWGLYSEQPVREVA